MAKKEPAAPSMEQFRAYIRAHGDALLRDPNVNSIGIGYRIKGKKRTDELCLQFTVNERVEHQLAAREAAELERLRTKKIEAISYEGVMLPTDVIARRFRSSHLEVEPELKSERKRRVDPLCPGVSVGHRETGAGTLGAIVFDAQTGAPCMLSNWHILQTEKGDLGDRIAQPGPYDDSGVDANVAGVLLRSRLGLAGDCAVARIEGRGFDPAVLGLGVRVERLAKPELDDHVVKSGRWSTAGSAFRPRSGRRSSTVRAAHCDPAPTC
jgi:endonuclease G